MPNKVEMGSPLYLKDLMPLSIVKANAKEYTKGNIIFSVTLTMKE